MSFETQLMFDEYSWKQLLLRRVFGYEYELMYAHAKCCTINSVEV